jgi:hypothetical protein
LQEKPLEDFHKRYNRPCGYKSRCIDCVKKGKKPKRSRDYMRKYDLKKSYNITIAQYDEMLLKQNDCCAICKRHKSEVTVKRKNHLCVDHNHSTGKIRGLLCDKCNRGIGLLCDSIDLLNNAIKYLHD